MSSISHVIPAKASLQPRARAAATLLCVLFGFIAPTSIFSATVYWDTNLATPGAGGATPSGTWSTSASNWGNANGNVATSVWGSNDSAIFSAGTDATGTYAITGSGTINVNDITMQEGSLTVTGGTLTLKNKATITVATGSSFTFGSSITANDFDKSGDGTLVFGTAQTFSSSIIDVNGGTISFTGTSSVQTLNIKGDSVLDFAGTSNLSVTNLNISSGVTLTLLNYAGTDTFNATTFKVNGTTVTAGTTTTSIVISGSPGVGVVYGSSGSIGIVPEPATYGSLFLGFSVAGFLLRRRPRCAA